MRQRHIVSEYLAPLRRHWLGRQTELKFVCRVLEKILTAPRDEIPDAHPMLGLLRRPEPDHRSIWQVFDRPGELRQVADPFADWYCPDVDALA